jgi:hypothetical protein
MSLIGRKSRKGRAEKVGSAADEEYEVVTGEASRLRSKIRDLEGFIDEAPQIREARDQETRVTLPPPEQLEHSAVTGGEEADDGEDLQERLGRRHLAAIRRSRRRNFYVFLVSAAAVAAFLYWVSQVVQ